MYIYTKRYNHCEKRILFLSREYLFNCTALITFVSTCTQRLLFTLKSVESTLII